MQRPQSCLQPNANLHLKAVCQRQRNRCDALHRVLYFFMWSRKLVSHLFHLVSFVYLYIYFVQFAPGQANVATQQLCTADAVTINYIFGDNPLISSSVLSEANTDLLPLTFQGKNPPLGWGDFHYVTTLNSLCIQQILIILFQWFLCG